MQQKYVFGHNGQADFRQCLNNVMHLVVVFENEKIKF